MRRFAGVGARLSLALLAVVTAALLIVYLAVVPSLEQRLVGARLDELERASARLARESVGLAFFELNDFAIRASEQTDARVVVLTVLADEPLSLTAGADSRQLSATDVGDDRIAQRALFAGAARGTVERNGERFAEAARLVSPEGPTILLLSAPLDETVTSVRFVERRLVVAGLAALLVALGLGYAGARLFTRRIRRLERAADRIAGGRLDEPVVDTQEDELGELARAFEEMRRRLAQLENARREFVANASHELRTPLFALGGHLELLADEEIDEPTRAEFLETMREQVERLTKLASDLLDLSRLDAGRLRVEQMPVELGKVARAVVREFRPLAESGGHELELIAADNPWALGDEQRIAQIGRILVENALVHTPPGTRVRVTATAEDGSAVLSVADDGPGVPSEEREQIFERFYRSGAARSSGSGLGLAIARELAGVMGGTLDADWEAGRPRFTLRLALHEAESRFHVNSVPIGTS